MESNTNSQYDDAITYSPRESSDDNNSPWPTRHPTPTPSSYQYHYYPPMNQPHDSFPESTPICQPHTFVPQFTPPIYLRARPTTQPYYSTRSWTNDLKSTQSVHSVGQSGAQAASPGHFDIPPTRNPGDGDFAWPPNTSQEISSARPTYLGQSTQIHETPAFQINDTPPRVDMLPARQSPWAEQDTSLPLPTRTYRTSLDHGFIQPGPPRTYRTSLDHGFIQPGPPQPPRMFQETQRASISQFHTPTSLSTPQRPMLSYSQTNIVPSYYQTQTRFPMDSCGFRAIRGRENDYRQPPFVFPAPFMDNSDRDAAYESLLLHRDNTPPFIRGGHATQTVSETERILPRTPPSQDRRRFPPRHTQTRVTYYSRMNTASLPCADPESQQMTSPPHDPNHYDYSHQPVTRSPQASQSFQRPRYHYQRSYSRTRDQRRPTVTWHRPVESLDTDSENISSAGPGIGMQTSSIFDTDIYNPYSHFHNLSQSDARSTLSTVPGFTTASASTSSLSSSASELSLPIVDPPHSSSAADKDPHECKKFRRLYKVRKLFTSKWIDDNLAFMMDPTTHPYNDSPEASPNASKHGSTPEGNGHDGGLTNGSPLTDLPVVKQLMALI